MCTGEKGLQYQPEGQVCVASKPGACTQLPCARLSVPNGIISSFMHFLALSPSDKHELDRQLQRDTGARGADGGKWDSMSTQLPSWTPTLVVRLVSGLMDGRSDGRSGDNVHEWRLVSLGGVSPGGLRKTADLACPSRLQQRHGPRINLLLLLCSACSVHRLGARDPMWSEWIVECP